MQKPDIGTTKIGCIGKSTSQAIRELGLRADFIGQSTDTKLVGKQFSARVGLGKVVFTSGSRKYENHSMAVS